jgi:iron complex transport system ATP-binding protein
MITCHDVSVVIERNTVLAGATFTLTPNSLVAIVGPNGAGKSTLLSILSGDRTPTSGSVSLNNIALESISSARLARMRAVLPQTTGTLFSFTAFDIVMMGRYNAPPGDDRAAVHEAMQRTQTAHLGNRQFPNLSGGEQALVSFARVLAQDTPVIFLDEPTAALDLAHQERVCTIAKQEALNGKSVIAVLHDLNLAAQFADQVIVINSGRIVANGTPVEVFTSSLLSSVYDTSLSVIDHPFRTGTPLVLPGAPLTTDPNQKAALV